MGLVWGWLLILYGGRTPWKRPVFTPIALFIGTLLITGYLVLYTLDTTIMVPFLIAVVVSGLIHLIWRDTLRYKK